MGLSSTTARPLESVNAPVAGHAAIRKTPVVPATIRSPALESEPDGTIQ